MQNLNLNSKTIMFYSSSAKFADFTNSDLENFTDSLIDQFLETTDPMYKRNIVSVANLSGNILNTRLNQKIYQTGLNKLPTKNKVMPKPNKNSAANPEVTNAQEVVNATNVAPKVYEVSDAELQIDDSQNQPQAPVMEGAPAQTQTAAPAANTSSRKPKTNLSNEDVIDIKRRMFLRETPKSIAEVYGIHPSTVSDIKVNRGRYAALIFTPNEQETAYVNALIAADEAKKQAAIQEAQEKAAKKEADRMAREQAIKDAAAKKAAAAAQPAATTAPATETVGS